MKIDMNWQKIILSYQKIVLIGVHTKLIKKRKHADDPCLHGSRTYRGSKLCKIPEWCRKNMKYIECI